MGTEAARRIRTLSVSTIAAVLLASLVATAQNDPRPASALAGIVMKRYVDRGEFMGTVLIAENGKALFRQAYGEADISWGIPNTVGTKFNIGSLTKQFTGLAVLQLVEAGKVRLDGPVSGYVPETPSSWQGITVEHLLNHRSGMGGPSGPADFPRGVDTTYTARELVNIVMAKPLEFAPGTRFKYSNAGFYVLGYLIELVSGQTYIDYLRSHVFEPLKMTQSGFDSVREIIPYRAVGYTGAAHRQYADRVDWSLAFSAGGLYSTVDDLLRWDRGLASGQLLGPALRAVFQPAADGYRAGWFVDRRDGTLRMYHEGSNPGYSAFICRFPAEGLMVVVLSNTENAPVRKIADDLVQAAHGTLPVSP